MSKKFGQSQNGIGFQTLIGDSEVLDINLSTFNNFEIANARK
jgi:hypothetical protein